MRPLSALRPKVLCPVANLPLIDWAIARTSPVCSAVAVNAHAHADAMRSHFEGRHVHLSVEPEPLGTAGALGALRGWLDGRPVLVVNGDTWCSAPLDALTEGWDGGHVRVLTLGGDGDGGADLALHPRSRIIASLLPAAVAASLPAEPLGLYEGVWRARASTGELETCHWRGPFVDCATVPDYLAANLAALDLLAGGWRLAPVGALARLGMPAPGPGRGDGGATIERSAVGEGASVAGLLRDSVVWPGARVAAGERLVRAVRTDSLTVLVR